MDRSLAQELISCLQHEPGYFYYYPDRYGVFLLKQAVTHTPRIADLRRGPFAPLLRKPAIKALVADQGSGLLSPDLFRYRDWQPAAEHFGLSIGTWEADRDNFRWNQTSRRGTNLVLRLDFPISHLRHYRRLIRPQGTTGCGPFENSGHPISRTRETLAWVRVDLDWERGEALIEEVQNDWLRKAGRAASSAARWLPQPPEKRPWPFRRIGGRWPDVVRYFEEYLAFHRRYWHEAVLTAALQLIVEVLGLRRIWYHSDASGRLFKRCGDPPRSLYTDLRRRFCFVPVEELPLLIKAEKRQKEAIKRAPREQVTLYRLDL